LNDRLLMKRGFWEIRRSDVSCLNLAVTERPYWRLLERRPRIVINSAMQHSRARPVSSLVLAERRSGYVIMLLESLLAFAVPVLHMKGKGVGVASGIAQSSGGFRFVWMLIALGVTGLFSAILSARGLWSLPRRRPGSQQSEGGRTGLSPADL
jgi:hypothetical protein